MRSLYVTTSPIATPVPDVVASLVDTSDLVRIGLRIKSVLILLLCVLILSHVSIQEFIPLPGILDRDKSAVFGTLLVVMFIPVVKYAWNDTAFVPPNGKTSYE